MSEMLRDEDTERPMVGMWRDSLLPISETFVRLQAESLVNFDYHYYGLHQTEGLDLPHQDVTVVNNGELLGKLREHLYKLCGVLPPSLRKTSSRGPNLIHAHFGQGGVFAMPFARYLDVPLLTSIYGSDITVSDSALKSTSRTAALYLRRRHELARKCDHFIANSVYLHNIMIEKGFPQERITVLPTGVDPSFFSPDESIAREPIVLFVGRLVENKGAAYLLRAMRQVQRIIPEARTVVIGDGPERNNLERLSNSLSLDACFVGKQSSTEIRSWMNRSRVFCVPSVQIESGASEGLGVVFLEAQAMKLPVVSFRTGGIPEAVVDGETGLLVEPGNLDGLFQSIIRLLENDQLWTQMGNDGRHWVSKSFDSGAQARKLERIYSSLIAK